MVEFRGYLLNTIIVVGVAICDVVAQPPTVFTNLLPSDGLSYGAVTCFAQDTDEFIWIGTKNGLNRYDGSRFKIFKTENSNITGDGISDILVYNDSILLISTHSGLNLYNRYSDIFQPIYFDFKSSLQALRINDLCMDSKGIVWLGTEDGLYYLKIQKNEFRIQEPVNLRSNFHRIVSIKQITDDLYYLGTNGSGLVQYNSIKNEFIKNDLVNPQLNKDAPKDVKDICQIDKDKFLLGTWGNGIYFFNSKLGFYKPLRLDEPIISDIKIVNKIAKGLDGFIWAATTGYGVVKFKIDNQEQPHQIQQFQFDSRLKNSLLENSVQTIFRDNNSNMWFGTSRKGISALPKVSLSFSLLYSDIKGLNTSGVLEVKKNQSELWIGTDGEGLNIYNTESHLVTNWKKGKGSIVNGNFVGAIEKLSNNEICIGTFSNGFSIYNSLSNTVEKHIRVRENENGLNHNHIIGFVEDRLQNIWIGTWGGGLNFYDRKTKRFRQFTHDRQDSGSLSEDDITVLAQKSPNEIWVGTWGGGLNLFSINDSTFIKPSMKPGQSNRVVGDNIISLFTDSNELLWVGTWGNGLSIYDSNNGTFTTYSKEDGLIDNVIKSVQEDDLGNIWISTRKGISKFNSQTREFRNYSDLGLLNNKEFHSRSGFKDDEGNIYFGGIEGILKISPELISKDTARLNVKMTNLKLFNDDVYPTKEGPLKEDVIKSESIKLKYDDDVITFEFSALRYPKADDCEYSVKMIGFEEEWRNIPDNSRSATYTNLNPGTYEFRVRARIKGSGWKKNYSSIEVYVAEPYWSTWWAFLGYTLIFIFLLYLFYIYISRWTTLKNNLELEQVLRSKENDLHELKQKLFSNISHELRTPITLISGAINQLSEKFSITKPQKRILAQISKNSGHLLQLINELLDFNKLDERGIQLHVDKGDFIEFCHEIFLSFNLSAEKKNIQFIFNSKDNPIQIYFDHDQMEKVLYNLISNAIKFTNNGGAIQVDFNQDDQFAYLYIMDDGLGISDQDKEMIFKPFVQGSDSDKSSEKGFGLGLSITKDIIELHGGEIQLESTIGKGSTFMIKLPLGSEHFAPDQLDEALKDQNGSNNYVAAETDLSENKNLFSYDIAGQSILIIEDNAEIRGYIESLFVTDFNVLTANNGKSGFESAVENQPHLIVSDVMMPIMDGITLTKKLKSDVQTSHIPIILLTARTTLVYKQEGYETGADAYITKPFNELLLKTQVRNLLRNRNLISEKIKKDIITEPGELDLNSPDQEFLANISRIIEDNIEEQDLSVTLIAEQLGMSHSIVYKKIKVLTGFTIVEFVREWRLKRAADLLSKHGFNISEACYKVGFSDKKYFSKVFKKRFGILPSQYLDS